MDENGRDGLPDDTNKSASDKGKSKSPWEEQEEKGPSMISRFQDSARMAGGTFVNARSGLPENMPSTSEGKVVPSGSASGSNSYQIKAGPTSAHAASRPIKRVDIQETFRRSQQSSSDVARAYDHFVDTHQSLPDVESLQLQPSASVELEQRPVFASDFTDRQHATAKGRSVAEVEATDGAAVADILSQPEAYSMLPAVEEQDEIISPDVDANIRAALFNTGSSGRLPWDHLLNFTPSFISAPDSSEQPEKYQAERAAHLGAVDQGEVAEMWLRGWSDVLSSYTDEVWGDLGALVQAAKHEVEELSTDGTGRTETPALSRLKMILGHVRGS